MDFLVVGGRQGAKALQKEEWHRYKSGLVARVSSTRGEIDVCIEYVSPPEVCADEHDPSILFKAGTLMNGILYLCTQTEVLTYDVSTFKQLNYVSLPFFNDLHHVAPTADDTLLVAVTGLDMVVEITERGEVLREWGVLGQNPWERFLRTVDYRRVVTTKPHESHPNFLFQDDSEIWVTRFEQKDAISLISGDRSIKIEVERPHDGIVFEDKVYFTTVNGFIVIADLKERRVVRVEDLNLINQRGSALGWCRGLAVIEPEVVVVGFSRLRPTRFRENVRWIGYELGLHESLGTLPARIVCYDLARSKEVWEINMEPCGLSAVFSIHPV